MILNFSKPIIALAPMAGITDLSFRVICKQFEADLVYSEMVSATGLFYDSQKTLSLMKTSQEEAPMILQLFGNEPKHFQKAAEFVSSLPEKSSDYITRPQGIDINFGCPQKKIFNQGSGCALMSDLKKAREIIKATVAGSTLPVSIKIRAGLKGKSAFDFLQEVGDLDWQTLMVHGRTYEEGFAGNANMELMKKVKEMFPEKTVLVNGGITSPEIAKEMLEKTGADGLGLARGVLGNPWLFQQIKDYFETGDYKKPTQKEITAVALEHINLYEKYKPESNPAEMKKHLFWYIKGFPEAKKIRQQIMVAESLEEMRSIIHGLI